VKLDTFRANAEFCRRRAGLVRRDVDTAAWRQLAQSWTDLMNGEARLIAARSALCKSAGTNKSTAGKLRAS
jgi:hypothetical protein